MDGMKIFTERRTICKMKMTQLCVLSGRGCSRYYFISMLPIFMAPPDGVI